MDNRMLSKQWEGYLQYLKDWADSHTDDGFVGCSPACFDEWLSCEGIEEAATRLPECDSEYCIFNPNGYCCVPLVYAKQPEITEDGCQSSIFRE